MSKRTGRPPKLFAIVMPGNKIVFYTRAQLAARAGISARAMQERQNKSNKYEYLVRPPR